MICEGTETEGNGVRSGAAIEKDMDTKYRQDLDLRILYQLIFAIQLSTVETECREVTPHRTGVCLHENVPTGKNDRSSFHAIIIRIRSIMIASNNSRLSQYSTQTYATTRTKILLSCYNRSWVLITMEISLQIQPTTQRGIWPTPWWA